MSYDSNWKASREEQKLYHQKYHKEWTKKYPEKRASYTRKSKLKSTYGISLNEYNELLKVQGNCCAICKKPQQEQKRNFAVDHDHNTGKIRGLLCIKCNRGIGLLQDNVDIIQEAVKYLRKSTI